MSKNEENEITLLTITAKDLIKKLKEEKDLIHLRETAYMVYSEETKEEFQVQITVTRRQSDFLEPFQTENMREWKPIN